MSIPYQQVSRDAARALEEFSDQFRNALVLMIHRGGTISACPTRSPTQRAPSLSRYRSTPRATRSSKAISSIAGCTRALCRSAPSSGMTAWRSSCERDRVRSVQRLGPTLRATWPARGSNLPLTMLAALLQGSDPATNAPAAYVGPLLDLYKRSRLEHREHDQSGSPMRTRATSSIARWAPSTTCAPPRTRTSRRCFFRRSLHLLGERARARTVSRSA
jgi:hypothetical protein